MMGGAQVWHWAIVPGMRLSLTEMLRPRPGAKQAMGHPTQSPLPSPDHGFESDQSSVSTPPQCH